MDRTTIPFYKERGETPLEAINRFKVANPQYRHMPVTYAGRLDPMAEGLLILLAGDDCAKKDDYLALSKEYELEILFGFGTDTYDLLGKVVGGGDLNSNHHLALSSSPPRQGGEEIQNSVSSIISQFTGKITQAYPPYSSRPVDGRPLFQWAREGKLNEIVIPNHEVIVHSISILSSREISGSDLIAEIQKVIPLVKGDFRQSEILKLWKETLLGREKNMFPLVKIVASVGSGTYMRVLAHDIGTALGVPALAYHIKRTKIGEYSF